MDKEQLQQKITDILSKDNVEGIILLVLKDGSTSILNLKNEDNEVIIKEYAAAVSAKCLTQEYELKNYSTADNRKDCLYVYDLPDVPDCFQRMKISKEEQERLSPFNAKVHKLNEVSGIIVILSDGEKNIVLFKNVYAIEIIGVRSRILVFHSNDQFERATNDMIRLTPDFDVVLIDNEFVITNLKSIERIQQLTQITLNVASARIDDISKINILCNLDKIRDMVKDDVGLAKKVIKIVSESPVLYKGVPNEKIIVFAKKKESKFGKLTYSEDQSQFDIQSKKELVRFLSILNNDLLWSELTEDDYFSTAKDLLQ